METKEIELLKSLGIKTHIKIMNLLKIIYQNKLFFKKRTINQR